MYSFEISSQTITNFSGLLWALIFSKLLNILRPVARFSRLEHVEIHVKTSIKLDFTKTVNKKWTRSEQDSQY